MQLDPERRLDVFLVSSRFTLEQFPFHVSLKPGSVGIWHTDPFPGTMLGE